jgi:hypothetical protein
MTDNTWQELLGRIGEARRADSATLQRLNYKAVATGLAMPYEVFHDLDASAQHLGIAEGVRGGRQFRVVWAVTARDGERTFGSVAVSIADFDALGRAEVSAEEAQSFRDMRDVFEEAGRLEAYEAERVFRERFRASVRHSVRARRHQGG